MARVSLALGADAAAEFDAMSSPQEDDDRLDRLVEQSQLSAPMATTALSALSTRMSAYPTLTPEEQAAALARCARGLEAQAFLEASTLEGAARRTDRQVRAAHRAVRDADAARAELVGSMYRLALVICKELATERYGPERTHDLLPDLVSEANIAVVEAIGTFDPAKVPAFSKYAGRVIRDRVRMCLQKVSPVGVAPSWLRLKRIYVVLVPEVEMRLGRTPTRVEMQEELRRVCMRWAADRLTDDQKLLPQDEQVNLMESKLRKQGMLGAIERIEDVLQATQHVASLDSPLGEDGGATLGGTIAHQDLPSDYDAVEHDELRRDLLEALSALSERERMIVLYKYGFVDGEQWTYAALAPKFGVSAERIRQIERGVLGKLRGPGSATLAPHLPSQVAV